MAEDYYELLKKEVIDVGLCTRCGSCVGICPRSALCIGDDLGNCLPEKIRECSDCGGECYLGCSGKYVDFPALNQVLYGGQPESYLLGHYKALWIANSADPEVRSKGASGGVITTALKHLFESDRIEGAYVLGDDPLRPYFPKSRLATNYEEVQSAAQSKYVVCPHNALLGDVSAEGGALAYVGLPCQVHSLRKLQQIGNPVAKRFRYVFGTYCGNALHFSSIRAFLVKHGVNDLNEVVRWEYRAGEWPGNMRVELCSGRVITMPKFHANYLIPFHIMKRCLLCADLCNEFTDISGGDAWAPVYEDRGKGFSMMVVRSTIGVELVDEMLKLGKLEAIPVDYEKTIEMHSHGLDLKKRGSFLRINYRKIFHQAIPEYGFSIKPGIPFPRRMMEILMGLVFRVCWSSLGQWLIQRIPNALIGAVFKKARTSWKSVTHATKKTGLGTIEFVVETPGGNASEDRKKFNINPLVPCCCDGETGPASDRKKLCS